MDEWPGGFEGMCTLHAVIMLCFCFGFDFVSVLFKFFQVCK